MQNTPQSSENPASVQMSPNDQAEPRQTSGANNPATEANSKGTAPAVGSGALFGAVANDTTDFSSTSASCLQWLRQGISLSDPWREESLVEIWQKRLGKPLTPLLESSLTQIEQFSRTGIELQTL